MRAVRPGTGAALATEGVPMSGAEDASGMAAALELAEEWRLPVFPCRPDKKPHTRHGLKEASTNVERITEWWNRWPGALVGVPTGCASRLVVVDIDPDDAEWYREHIHDLRCARVHQTRRGHHLLYRMPEVEIRNSAGRIAPGVDVRGEGGFVIWWPAHGLEAVGGIEDLTELPGWLLDQLRNGVSSSARPEQVYITEGGRNDYLSREAYRLRKQGASIQEITQVLRAVNEARCRPPLDDREVAVIAAGKARVEPEAIDVTRGVEPDAAPISLADFLAYMPDHKYVFIPSRELWPASSVDARLPWPEVKVEGKDEKKRIRPSKYIDRAAPVEQMIWAPGEPLLIEGRIIDGGGWLEHQACTTFNLYRPPLKIGGNPSDCGPWLKHLSCIYPEDASHIIMWLAQRVQRPGKKINHALVLGGLQGIGKDTLLEPVKLAVGPWNFAEVSPAVLLGRFNGFIKSVILRVSEARDLGEVDRYSFYEHTKVYTAAPPDVLRCDEKYLREHPVLNACGVVITTNHKTDGIYLSSDDRRHYVAWSERAKEDFSPEYWTRLWGWYANGGLQNVAAYLSQVDLSGFDSKAPPPKTSAWWQIVDASRVPEDAELADALDALGNPLAVTLEMISGSAIRGFSEWLLDRRNSRQIPHRLEEAGYESMRNTATKDGLWVVNGRRQVVYARRELSIHDRFMAVTSLLRR